MSLKSERLFFEEAADLFCLALKSIIRAKNRIRGRGTVLNILLHSGIMRSDKNCGHFLPPK